MNPLTPNANDDEVTDAPEVPRGSKTLNVGPPGSGKTTALITYIKAGVELFAIGTDPGFEESLLDAMREHDLPMDMLHYVYIGAGTPSWEALKSAATKIGQMDYKNLTEIKAGVDKHLYRQYLEVLDTLANFKCAHCKKEFGAVDSWTPEQMRALAVDSLTGINTMALDLMIGGKPVAHQGEYGVAMAMEEKLILTLCANIKCFVTITAHLDRELNALTGVPQQMVGALGSKLAPKIPRSFSDVVLSVKDGTSFHWSTAATNVDLKNRALKISEKLPPDYRQMVEAWKARCEYAGIDVEAILNNVKEARKQSVE